MKATRNDEGQNSNKDTKGGEGQNFTSDKIQLKHDMLAVVDNDYVNHAMPKIAIFARWARMFILFCSVVFAVIFFYCAQSQAQKFWKNDGMINPATFNDQREILIGLMTYAVLVWSLCCHELYFVLSIHVMDKTKNAD